MKGVQNGMKRAPRHLKKKKNGLGAFSLKTYELGRLQWTYPLAGVNGRFGKLVVNHKTRFDQNSAFFGSKQLQGGPFPHKSRFGPFGELAGCLFNH